MLYLRHPCACDVRAPNKKEQNVKLYLRISQTSFHVPHLLPLLLFPPHLPVQVELSRPSSRRAGNYTCEGVSTILSKGNMLQTSPAHDIVVELWRLVYVPENTY